MTDLAAIIQAHDGCPPACLVGAIEARFVLVPRDEYTAEVESARLKAIADMETP